LLSQPWRKHEETDLFTTAADWAVCPGSLTQSERYAGIDGVLSSPTNFFTTNKVLIAAGLNASSALTSNSFTADVKALLHTGGGTMTEDQITNALANPIYTILQQCCDGH